MPTAVTVLKGARGDFVWSFRVLSGLMTTLALVALARHAFVTWSLSRPLQLVMKAYADTLRVLFSWAEPHVQTALAWLGSFIGWHPTLYPLWRDVFVLLTLLATGLVRGLTHGSAENRSTGVALVIFVGGSSAIAAIIAGIVPLQSDALAPQLLLAASFGMGWLLVGVLGAVVSGLSYLAAMTTLALILGGIPVLLTWVLSFVFGSVTGLGLLGLAFSIAVAGISLVVLDKFDRGGPSQVFWAWSVGFTILSGFVGAAIFFAVDAGLTLLLGK